MVVRLQRGDNLIICSRFVLFLLAFRLFVLFPQQLDLHKMHLQATPAFGLR